MDWSLEHGQGLVEYALLLVLVAVVVIAIFTVFGEEISRLYTIVTALDALSN